MAAGGHFGCPKFDRSSGPFISIRYYYFYFIFDKIATVGHFGYYYYYYYYVCISGSPDRSTHLGYFFYCFFLLYLHLYLYLYLFNIFVILVDVVFSFLVSFSNISFVVILVDGSVCIPGHVSMTCSCVSIFSGHFLHFVSLYLPLKLFLRPTFWFLL